MKPKSLTTGDLERLKVLEENQRLQILEEIKEKLLEYELPQDDQLIDTAYRVLALPDGPLWECMVQYEETREALTDSSRLDDLIKAWHLCENALKALSALEKRGIAARMGDKNIRCFNAGCASIEKAMQEMAEVVHRDRDKFKRKNKRPQKPETPVIFFTRSSIARAGGV